MKKLLFLAICATLLITCKKEKTELSESSTADAKHVDKTQGDDASNSHATIKELNIGQATELLKGRSADTLYVTNFFATWCPPCVREIPHFKDKMKEMRDQPVKFTFVSLDNRDVWNTEVSDFVNQHGIRPQTVLLDGNTLDISFFTQNFKTWRGESIPFTILRKGSQTEEINGSISREELDKRIASFR